MKDEVLVTGATGFTGSYVVSALLNAGFRVSCLVRASSDRSRLAAHKVRYFVGCLDRPEELARILRGHQILVSVASLGFGRAKGIITAARRSDIERAIFFSSTSIFTTLNPSSPQVRIEAEAMILNSGLDYTILRPTMIYGGGW